MRKAIVLITILFLSTHKWNPAMEIETNYAIRACVHVCLPEIQNSDNSPYMCSAAYYCYSQNDTYTGNIFKGKCESSIGGSSYCSLFP